MNPLISIITPSYNQGQFVEATINSVLNQTYENIEYILIDGGSKDCTLNVVDKYSSKIDIIIIEEDHGQANAINKGFKLSSGDLVGWINSDDLLYNDCVKNIVEAYMKYPKGSIFYNSKIDYIDAESKFIGIYERKSISKRRLIHKNYDVIQPGSFYNRNNINLIGGLNEKLNFCFDLDLWLNLLCYGEIVDIKKDRHAAFRIWDETKTSKGKQKFLKEIISVLLKHGARNCDFSINKAKWYIMKNNIKEILNL